ncbi:YdcF family protein [Sphingomonas oligophenolica]|uniref:YdcF family protein n=1 Tax=Sphingomonas oligophenolica TaxID=301154 RepID=A0A502CS76_9SPHN|nr:YdcF family protein [Sphingomonas oligophenolica]TPG15582.1 YdcF family protein [Sphingomonas oligophenolica]
MRRLATLVGTMAMLWCLGFAVFMLLLPKPLEGNTTDAIVVPTGAAGRIDRGIALLKAHQARRMLVTGVAPGVSARDLAREYNTAPRWFACCIDLGTDAVDTRSNAAETATWVKAHSYRTIRLVSSDWHVPRARMELGAALGDKVLILGDGVPGTPRLGTLVNEYNKLLLRRVALWLGLDR